MDDATAEEILASIRFLSDLGKQELMIAVLRFRVAERNTKIALLEKSIMVHQALLQNPNGEQREESVDVPATS